MRISSLVAVISAVALSSSFIAPTLAYHENTRTYPHYTSSTNYLPSSIIDDIVTALREEKRSYQWHDAMHRKFPTERAFSTIARERRDHVADLEDLLRHYDVRGISHPRASIPHLYAEDDACRLGAQNEERIQNVYSILIPKVRSYPDILRLFERFEYDSRHEFLPLLRNCSVRTVTYPSSPTYVRPIIHKPIVREVIYRQPEIRLSRYGKYWNRARRHQNRHVHPYYRKRSPHYLRSSYRPRNYSPYTVTAPRWYRY